MIFQLLKISAERGRALRHWASRAAGLTPACASWSPSPRPPPQHPPHSPAGTPGSAEGPRRLARRAPAGGPRRSRWRARPAGKGPVGTLCRWGQTQPCSASPPLPGGAPDQGEHVLPAFSHRPPRLPHRTLRAKECGRVRPWTLGLLRGWAGWGGAAHRSHSVPRDEEADGEADGGGPAEEAP